MTNTIIIGLINIVGFCAGFWILLILVERYAKREVEMQMAKLEMKFTGLKSELQAWMCDKSSSDTEEWIRVIDYVDKIIERTLLGKEKND